jgi:hypothetical protein
VQPHPPALAAGVIILDAHGDDGADAREAVDHHADERAIAQADQGRGFDAVEQMARLILGQYRRLATAHDVLGPAHRMGRIDGENLADDEPIEQHADRREVLLHRRLGGRRLQRLDVSRDVHGLNVGELADAMLLDPGEERAHGPVISHAGVFVADVGGKVFQKPSRGMIAGTGDRGRNRDRATQRRHPDRALV